MSYEMETPRAACFRPKVQPAVRKTMCTCGRVDASGMTQSIGGSTRASWEGLASPMSASPTSASPRPASPELSDAADEQPGTARARGGIARRKELLRHILGSECKGAAGPFLVEIATAD